MPNAFDEIAPLPVASGKNAFDEIAPQAGKPVRNAFDEIAPPEMPWQAGLAVDIVTAEGRAGRRLTPAEREPLAAARMKGIEKQREIKPTLGIDVPFINTRIPLAPGGGDPESFASRRIAQPIVAAGRGMGGMGNAAVQAFAPETGNAVAENLAANLKTDDNWTNYAAEIGGNVLPMVAAAVAAPAAGLTAGLSGLASFGVSSALPSAIGAVSGAGQVRGEIAAMRQQGAEISGLREAGATAFGSLVEGVTEGVSAGTLGKIGKLAAGNVVTRSVPNIIARSVAGSAATNAVEEGAAQLGYNAIAKGIYDPSRELGQGVPEAAGAGAVGSVFFSPMAIHGGLTERTAQHTETIAAATKKEIEAGTATAPEVLGGKYLNARQRLVASVIQRATGANVVVYRQDAPDTEFGVPMVEGPAQDASGNDARFSASAARGGFYNPKTNTYYVNASKGDRWMVGIMAHEMVHASSPEFRAEFARRFPELQAIGEQMAANVQSTDPEEATAYAIERLMLDPAMQEQMAQQAPGMFGQIADMAQSIEDAMAGGNAGKKTLIRRQMKFLDLLEQNRERVKKLGVQQQVAPEVPAAPAPATVARPQAPVEDIPVRQSDAAEAMATPEEAEQVRQQFEATGPAFTQEQQDWQEQRQINREDEDAQAQFDARQQFIEGAARNAQDVPSGGLNPDDVRLPREATVRDFTREQIGKLPLAALRRQAAALGLDPQQSRSVLIPQIEPAQRMRRLNGLTDQELYRAVKDRGGKYQNREQAIAWLGENMVEGAAANARNVPDGGMTPAEIQPTSNQPVSTPEVAPQAVATAPEVVTSAQEPTNAQVVPEVQRAPEQVPVREEAPAKTEVAAKEPWEMTRAEYEQDVRASDEEILAREPRHLRYSQEEIADLRRREVAQAFAANKPVPASVLADYPDLQPIAPQPGRLSPVPPETPRQAATAQSKRSPMSFRDRQMLGDFEGLSPDESQAKAAEDNEAFRDWLWGNIEAGKAVTNGTIVIQQKRGGPLLVYNAQTGELNPNGAYSGFENNRKHTVLDDWVEGKPAFAPQQGAAANARNVPDGGMSPSDIATPSIATVAKPVSQAPLLQTMPATENPVDRVPPAPPAQTRVRGDDDISHDEWAEHGRRVADNPSTATMRDLVRATSYWQSYADGLQRNGAPQADIDAVRREYNALNDLLAMRYRAADAANVNRDAVMDMPVEAFEQRTRPAKKKEPTNAQSVPEVQGTQGQVPVREEGAEAQESVAAVSERGGEEVAAKDAVAPDLVKQVRREGSQREIIKALADRDLSGAMVLRAGHKGSGQIVASGYYHLDEPIAALERLGLVEVKSTYGGAMPGLSTGYAGPGSAQAKGVEKGDRQRNTYRLTDKGRAVAKELMAIPSAGKDGRSDYAYTPSQQPPAPRPVVAAKGEKGTNYGDTTNTVLAETRSNVERPAPIAPMSISDNSRPRRNDAVPAAVPEQLPAGRVEAGTGEARPGRTTVRSAAGTREAKAFVVRYKHAYDGADASAIFDSADAANDFARHLMPQATVKKGSISGETLPPMEAAAKYVDRVPYTREITDRAAASALRSAGLKATKANIAKLREIAQPAPAQPKESNEPVKQKAVSTATLDETPPYRNGRIAVTVRGGKTGQLTANRIGDELQIQLAQVAPDERGTGVGKEMYAKLMEYAKANRLRAVSGKTITVEAARAWDSMRKAGYPVSRNPTAVTKSGYVRPNDGSAAAYWADFRDTKTETPPTIEETPEPDVPDVEGDVEAEDLKRQVIRTMARNLNKPASEGGYANTEKQQPLGRVDDQYVIPGAEQDVRQQQATEQVVRMIQGDMDADDATARNILAAMREGAKRRAVNPANTVDDVYQGVVDDLGEYASESGTATDGITHDTIQRIANDAIEASGVKERAIAPPEEADTEEAPEKLPTAGEMRGELDVKEAVAAARSLGENMKADVIPSRTVERIIPKGGDFRNHRIEFAMDEAGWVKVKEYLTASTANAQAKRIAKAGKKTAVVPTHSGVYAVMRWYPKQKAPATSQSPAAPMGEAARSDEVKFSRDAYHGDGPFKVNPAAMTNGQLNRMHQFLKAKGYDSRGGEDVRQMLKTRILRNGEIPETLPDWREAYSAAVSQERERAKKTAANAAAKEQYKNIDWSRLRALGTTADLREAGYITPSGSLIDLSGKREGGTPGMRSYDHREAGGTAGMQEAMAAGYIRYFPESDGIDLAKAPTREQEKQILRAVEKADGKVVLDLRDGIGEYSESNEFYGSPARKTQLEYPEGTKPAKIIGDIRRFYAGEDIEPGIRYSTDAYHNSPTSPFRIRQEAVRDARSDVADVRKGQTPPDRRGFKMFHAEVRRLAESARAKGAGSAVASLQDLKRQAVKIVRELLPTEVQGEFLRDVASIKTLKGLELVAEKAQGRAADVEVRDAIRYADDAIKGGTEKIVVPRAAKEDSDAGKTPEEIEAEAAKRDWKRRLNREIDTRAFTDQQRKELRNDIAAINAFKHGMNATTGTADRLAAAESFRKMVDALKEKAATWQLELETEVDGRKVAMADAAKEGAALVDKARSNAMSRTAIGSAARSMLTRRTFVEHLFGKDSAAAKILSGKPEADRRDKHRYMMASNNVIAGAIKTHLGIEPNSAALEEWRTKEIDLTLPDAGKIKLTRDQAADLWGIYTDPELTEHLDAGQFIQLSDDETETTTRITGKDIQALAEQGVIGAKEKAYIAALKEHYAKWAPAVMDASVRLKGSSPDHHEGYWHTRRRMAYKDQEIKGGEYMTRDLRNQGMTEKRELSDTTLHPYLVRGSIAAFDAYNNQAGDLMYRAEGVMAVHNLLNGRNTMELRNAIKAKFGPAALRYLDRYLNDLAGVPKRPLTPPEKLVRWATKNMARAVIGLNKNVFVLNAVGGPISTMPFFDAEDWQYGARMMFDPATRARSMTHPDIWARYNGEMFQHLTLLSGETVPSVAVMGAKESARALKQHPSFRGLGAMADSLPFMRMADATPMAQIYASAEHWAQRTMPKATEAERRAAVEAKVTDVMLATQNGSSPTELSDASSIFRSNPLLAPLVMFTSDQNKKLNLLSLAFKGKMPKGKVVAAIGLNALLYGAVAPVGAKGIAEVARALFGGEQPDDENEELVAKGAIRTIRGVAGMVYFGEEAVDVVNAFRTGAPQLYGDKNAASRAAMDLGNFGLKASKWWNELDPDQQQVRWDSAKTAFWRAVGSSRTVAGDPTVMLAREMKVAIDAAAYDTDDLVADRMKKLLGDQKVNKKARDLRARAARIMADDPGKARRYLEYAEELEGEAEPIDAADVQASRKYQQIQRAIADTKSKARRGLIPQSVAEARIKRLEGAR